MNDGLARMNDAAEVERVTLLCDAAEEWAEWLDLKADELAVHGSVGRHAATVTRHDAQQIREAILAYRPLRTRDTETGEWVAATIGADTT
jgi:hypothetical protein